MESPTNTEYLLKIGENAIDFVIRMLSEENTQPKTPEMTYYYRGQIDAITNNMLPAHAKGAQARALLHKCESRLATANMERDKAESKALADKMGGIDG